MFLTRTTPSTSGRTRAALSTAGRAKKQILITITPDAIVETGADTYEVIDFPASYHNRATGLSYVDGHAEIHRWRDPRTMPVIQSQDLGTWLLNNRSQDGNNNKDIFWMQDHTTRFVGAP